MGWVEDATPRPSYSLVKKPGASCKEVGYTSEPVWTGAKISSPTRIRYSDRPGRSESRKKTVIYFYLFLFKLHFTPNTFNLEFTSQVEEIACTYSRLICGIVHREKFLTYAHIYLNFSCTFEEIKFNERLLHKNGHERSANICKNNFTLIS
jgi:hypothetical protein